MTFVSQQLVRFAHVDAAGIVFYPRYFEMLNAAVEDYFAQAVGVDFAAMHIGRRVGVPTVKLEAEFVAVSRLGDLLDFELSVQRVGGRSAEVAVRVRCRDEARFHATVVLVCMSLGQRPVAALARRHPACRRRDRRRGTPGRSARGAPWPSRSPPPSS